ncbi:dienelactone hydrolase family protein [Mesorhizobium sp. YC-39]|uniref:dienelactone hydrolase family protein n=1 Tax=unclassified Mesorhizobium TaxID=325217 RepID=UPI0021E98293|nr:MULTISPECIES: dienelactone hydrolase family protein [unclassified Mesorhizobium]MCV3210168.1 dienelactone hydrolase family protein [Mesorhizobium sp. YC-2]MCV3230698.1 dienelactone hydrolase family protein [Mesorhizobium sp. YC-39]
MGLLKNVYYLVCFTTAGYLYTAPASADQPVQFESAASEPTSFQVRNAQQNGHVLKAVSGTPLQGYLMRPPGEGPFPAIVVLHGCSGLFPSVKKTWSERLSSWGYVVLVVDSFSTRGIKETCDGLHSVDRVYDAYGALDFLSKDSFVDPQRIALMGFSAGGSATLEALQLGGDERLMERKFKAAIAYYPDCSATNGDMAVPTLILIGELDDRTPSKKCQEMMAQRSGKGSTVQLDVYPGARHAFDFPGLQTGTEEYRMEYNAAAADQSISAVRAFLKEAFNG